MMEQLFRFCQTTEAIELRAKLSRVHPAYFRDSVRIDDGTPDPPIFSQVIEPFQQKDHEALERGWMKIARRGAEDVYFASDDDPEFLRAYLERARGHSKSTDLALMGSWVIWASDRKVKGVVAAGDKEQAGFILEKVDAILRLNPWIKLELQKDRLVNHATGSEMIIVSSDEDSSYGETPDFVILDELTHWSRRGLFDSLFSAIAKRSICMLVIISNAGTSMGDSWQWEVREEARKSDSWYFHRVDGPQARWITPENLEEQRKMLPPAAFARLWLNKWQKDAGDGVDPADVDLCKRLHGPRIDLQKFHSLEGLKPMIRGPVDQCIIGALDLGITNDHAALVFGSVHRGSRTARLLAVKSWKPSDYESGKIPLREVESFSIAACRLVGCDLFYADQYQAVRIVEEMNASGIKAATIAFGSAGVHSGLGMSLLEFFGSHRVYIWPDDSIEKQIEAIKVKERPEHKDFKLIAPKSVESGHCDIGVAIALFLWRASLWIDLKVLTKREEDANSSGLELSLSDPSIVLNEDDYTPEEREDLEKYSEGIRESQSILSQLIAEEHYSERKKTEEQSLFQDLFDDTDDDEDPFLGSW